MNLYYVSAFIVGLCVSVVFVDDTEKIVEAPREEIQSSVQPDKKQYLLRPSSSLLESAVSRFDNANKVANWQLNQVERLAFSLDEDQIQGFLARIEAAENPERFASVVTALYARWAEIDPQAAAEAAYAREDFREEAARGAMLTWLENEEGDALEWIANVQPENTHVLKDWVKLSSVENFSKIAKAIEFLEQNWAEGADGLGYLLGERWIMSDDWRAAAAWASEDGDVQRSDAMLSRMARLRGESSGLEALEIASLIEGEKTLENARKKIFYWWGFESPTQAIEDLQATGLPDDWSRREINNMANGVVGKYPELLEDFIDLAGTEEQRDAACLGALWNMDRWVIHELNPAALQMSDTMADTKRGRKALERYYQGLHKEDPKKAREFYKEVSNTKKLILSGVQL